VTSNRLSSFLRKMAWDMPPELTNYRVGGARLPDVVKLPDSKHGERQVALEYASIRRASKTPSCKGVFVWRGTPAYVSQPVRSDL
jgi:hypothetical protein